MIQELSTALEWLKSGHTVTVATVFKTWGSAPRREGSLMIVRDDEMVEGSVSGGCIESDVILHAVGHQQSMGIKTLNYAVSTNAAWQAGLACGGEIDVLLFSLTPEDTIALQACIKSISEERKTCILHVHEHTGEVSESIADSESPFASPVQLENNLLSLCILPKPKMVIIGAVHIAKSLASFAATCGHEVIIIDPRGIFTESRNFSGATIIHDWPDEFFDRHPLDSNSALVTLTHDPKLDDAALRHALTTDAYYIGSLGSRITHASRIERLKPHFDESALKRIYGPVGLAIGSATPEEIATSIIAEIIAVRRGQNDR